MTFLKCDLFVWLIIDVSKRELCEINLNFQGSPAKAGAEKPKVAPKPRGGAPPPPPPSAPAGGPPPPPPGGVPAPKQDDGIDTSALFASINQGSQITAGECLTW